MYLIKGVKLMSEYSLFHGDCLEIMKEIPDKSIDMILCDMPYGTTRNKWDTVINLELLWEQYERIIKDNGAIVLFAQTPFDKVLGASNLKLLKYEWIWEKHKPTGHLNAKKMPLKKHENILIFYKKLPRYNPQGVVKDGKTKVSRTNHGNYGECSKTTVREFTNYPSSILNFNNVHSNKQLHPTQKPVELLEYLIKTYTDEHDLVLDNCMGSGSTGVACMNINRNFIGIELEETYFNIAKQRIEEIIKK
jgi:site-specific DNA-methyltransferase (adenine-specific)